MKTMISALALATMGFAPVAMAQTAPAPATTTTTTTTVMGRPLGNTGLTVGAAVGVGLAIATIAVIANDDDDDAVTTTTTTR